MLQRPAITCCCRNKDRPLSTYGGDELNYVTGTYSRSCLMEAHAISAVASSPDSPDPHPRSLTILCCYPPGSLRFSPARATGTQHYRYHTIPQIMLVQGGRTDRYMYGPPNLKSRKVESNPRFLLREQQKSNAAVVMLSSSHIL